MKRSRIAKLTISTETVRALNGVATARARGGVLHDMQAADPSCNNGCGTTSDAELCKTGCPGACSRCGF